jgi:hypothetical protein
VWAAKLLPFVMVDAAPLTLSRLRSLRHLSADERADLLASPPLGIRSHLLHAFRAVKNGDCEVVKTCATRAYQLGVELCDPRARADAETILNAAGWEVVGKVEVWERVDG